MWVLDGFRIGLWIYHMINQLTIWILRVLEVSANLGADSGLFQGGLRMERVGQMSRDFLVNIFNQKWDILLKKLHKNKGKPGTSKNEASYCGWWQ